MLIKRRVKPVMAQQPKTVKERLHARRALKALARKIEKRIIKVQKVIQHSAAKPRYKKETLKRLKKTRVCFRPFLGREKSRK